MVIDKKGIQRIWRATEEDFLAHQKEDSIYITTPYPHNKFNVEKQISNDSIDLRIADEGYVYSNDYAFVNTLSSSSFDAYFKKVPLKVDKGYDLKPGEILFIGTLERVALSGNLIGRISGRSTFSRFGLSVHCTQDKFSSGINSIVPLQIKNNSNAVLKIFPYQKLVQLIIEKTNHNDFPYDGNFSNETEYKLPFITDKDRDQYSPRERDRISGITPSKKSRLNGAKEKIRSKHSIWQSVSSIAITAAITILGTLEDGTPKIVAIGCLYAVMIVFAIFFYSTSPTTKEDNE